MKLRRSTIITAGCLAVVAGIGLQKYFGSNPSLIPLASLLPVLLVRRKYLFGLLAAIAIGLCVGLWRGYSISANQHLIDGLSNQKTTFVLKASQDAVYGNNHQLDFNGRIISAASISKPITGNFRVSGFGLPMVYRGDIFRVSGKIRKGSGSYQGYISYAQLELLSSDHSAINRWTRKFTSGLQNALSEPNASFSGGLLVGQRNNIPDDLYQKLIIVGLVHIVAVSGYNLTILVRATYRLKLFSKYQRLILSLSLIVIFLLITGNSASIVRAAIVSGLGLWAAFYGRRIKPVLLISFTAALTAIVYPYYVWGDMGWYLSFMAFFGILVIAPVIAKRLFRRPPRFLTATLLETLCAELMVIPIIMFTFGQLSLIGILANLLAVPLIPLAMLLSTLAGLAGMIAPTLAGWLAWPANFLLTYILDIVRWFSSIPGIFQKRSISLATMLVFYCLIAIVIFIFCNRRQIITDKIGSNERTQ